MKHFEDADPETTLARLRSELHAIGMLADSAGTTEDSKAGDLALDFDHWCLCVLADGASALTVRQRALLNALDAYFDAMSQDGQEDLWTDDAIRRSAEWADIRGLAMKALASFGWERGTASGEVGGVLSPRRPGE